MAQLALGLGVAACRASATPYVPDTASYVGVETSAHFGKSRATFFSPTGARLGSASLDFRAHGLVQHSEILVVFPRRPNNRFAVVDWQSRGVRTTITAPPNRHYFGHGAFSADGHILLAAESDTQTLKGVIGLYDMRRHLRRLGEIALPGPGPHDIQRLPGEDRFLIALGGLETHPDYGRSIFNASSFRSQMLLLDLARGTVEGLGYWPGTEGISLRHHAIDGTGRLYVGGQVVDKDRASNGHVLWAVENGEVTPLADGAQLSGYVSSVAAYGDSAVVTSKEAGVALHFEQGRLSNKTLIDGASAAARGPHGPVVSGFAKLALGANDIEVAAGYEFDNHGLLILP